IMYLVLKNISSVLGVLRQGIGILTPIWIGIVLAFLLNLPLKFFEKILFPRSKKPIVAKLRRPLSLAISYLVFFAVLALILFMLIPQLIEMVKILSDAIPTFFFNAEQWLGQRAEEIPRLGELLKTADRDWHDMGETMVNFLMSGTNTIFSSAINLLISVFNITLDFILGLFLSIYLLLGKNKLKSQLKRVSYAFLNNKRAKRLIEVGSLINATLSSFVSAELLQASILGVLCFIGMLIFRFPFAPMISVLIGITALVPLVGSFVGTGIGAFMIFMISPIRALWFVVFIIILQQLEGNIIYPKIVSDSIGLPALWVLVAVILGGSLMGILGMLISVPLSSVVYVLFKEATASRLKKKKEPLLNDQI
ncbi:MAG TPA: AI-2E family transporter, partial [Bacillota bacterium]|nr:AI-2E family transporter [Bacillota bacterium]